MFFECLPDEIVLRIFKQSTIKENSTYESSINEKNLVNFSKVNKQFHRIAQDQSLPLFKILLAKALKKAVCTNNVKKTKALLTLGANPNYIFTYEIPIKDPYYNIIVNGKTLLNVSISLGFYNIAVLLLKKGAEINISCSWSKTSLHVAAFFQKARFAKLLIDYGADIHIQDNYGNTAADIARMNQYTNERRPKLIAALKTNSEWRSAFWEEDNLQRRCTLI